VLASSFKLGQDLNPLFSFIAYVNKLDNFRSRLVRYGPHHRPALELDRPEVEERADPGDGIRRPDVGQDPRGPHDRRHRQELPLSRAVRVPLGHGHSQVRVLLVWFSKQILW